MKLNDLIEKIEIRAIKRALIKGKTKAKASELLGLNRTTFVMKCQKYGISKKKEVLNDNQQQ